MGTLKTFRFVKTYVEKVIKVVSKNDDTSNIEYWRSLTGVERLKNLEKIRKEVIKQKYGVDPGFQRVVRVIRKK